MNIETLRKEINRENEAISTAFARRIALCRRIGERKRASGLPVRDREREKNVLTSVSVPDAPGYGEALFSTVMTLCRAVQTEETEPENGIADSCTVTLGFGDGAAEALNSLGAIMLACGAELLNVGLCDGGAVFTVTAGNDAKKLFAALENEFPGRVGR